MPPSCGSPPPPPDFGNRKLPVEILPHGTRLARIHHAEFDPLHFGSKAGNRFDDPNGIHGVCYLAMKYEGAFAETCLRDVDARFLIQSYVQARSFSEMTAIAPLRLASLHGSGLARVGATSAVASGSSALSGESTSRSWPLGGTATGTRRFLRRRSGIWRTPTSSPDGSWRRLRPACAATAAPRASFPSSCPACRAAGGRAASPAFRARTPCIFRN